MNWREEFDDQPDDPEELEETSRPKPQDDPTFLAIEPQLRALFAADRDAVYYETQINILFEKEFFHWVTSRALKVLRETGQIGSSLVALPGVGQIRFYFHRQNRYWKRRAASIRAIVSAFSEPAVTRAIGHQGELLIDAGLPRAGFLPAADTVSTWALKTWTETNHDLDRVFVRDGIAYGLEIKNKLSYIDWAEFQVKLRMCRHLELRPLFVARMMPKTYIQQVRQAGGFCLLMGRQFYPIALADLAGQVKTELGLPVDTPSRIEDGTLNRLLNWHLANLNL